MPSLIHANPRDTAAAFLNPWEDHKQATAIITSHVNHLHKQDPNVLPFLKPQLVAHWVWVFRDLHSVIQYIQSRSYELNKRGLLAQFIAANVLNAPTELYLTYLLSDNASSDQHLMTELRSLAEICREVMNTYGSYGDERKQQQQQQARQQFAVIHAKIAEMSVESMDEVLTETWELRKLVEDTTPSEKEAKETNSPMQQQKQELDKTFDRMRVERQELEDLFERICAEKRQLIEVLDHAQEKNQELCGTSTMASTDGILTPDSTTVSDAASLHSDHDETPTILKLRVEIMKNASLCGEKFHVKMHKDTPFSVLLAHCQNGGSNRRLQVKDGGVDAFPTDTPASLGIQDGTVFLCWEAWYNYKLLDLTA